MPEAQINNNQAEMAARLQAAQIFDYQNQVAQINAAQMANATMEMEVQARLEPLRKKERELVKKTSGWKRYYIILLFGAVLTDGFSIIFQIIGIIIPPANFFSDMISMIYSAIRFMALRAMNIGASKNEEWLRNIRTFGAGVIKLVPIIGAVPLQTMTMITEWQLKKAESTKYSSELRSVRNQMKQLSR